MCMCKLGFACLLPTERFGQTCVYLLLLQWLLVSIYLALVLVVKAVHTPILLLREKQVSERKENSSNKRMCESAKRRKKEERRLTQMHTKMMNGNCCTSMIK